MEFIVAEVEVLGDPTVVPGAMVNLKKLGIFGGHYLVVEANHFYDAAGYNTIFYVARDKWGDSSNETQKKNQEKKKKEAQKFYSRAMKNNVRMERDYEREQMTSEMADSASAALAVDSDAEFTKSLAAEIAAALSEVGKLKGASKTHASSAAVSSVASQTPVARSVYDYA